MKTNMLGCKDVFIVPGLYPTFKEWKQISHTSKVKYIFRLYPTFKEWKPYSSISIVKPPFLVYILPLRNENLLKFISTLLITSSFISYL